MSKPRTLSRDRRGPNEPSYTPKGLRWVYWSDLGQEERFEFLREREPRLEEVQAWLLEQGLVAVPLESVKPPVRGSN